MEKDKFQTPNQDDDWFENLINPAKKSEEIQIDEEAVSPHQMSDLADAELERILKEALSEDWNLEDSLEGISEPMPQVYMEPAQDVQPEPTPVYEPQVQEQVQPAEPEYEGGVPRKVRPKRKDGYGFFGIPHILSTIIWLVIAVAIGVSLGNLLWVCATDVLAFGRQDSTVSITITASDNLDSITNKLYNAGLIQYPSLFKMYAKLAQVEEKEKISVGTFELNTLYDYHALVGGMSATSSYRETVKVIIPEGYTCQQIYTLLEEKGVCSAADMEAYASESQFDSYWFLENVEKGSKYCLEGFMFPSTYEFYTNDDPRRVFIKFLGAFEENLPEDFEAKLASLNERLAAKYKKNGIPQSYIDEHKITVKEMIIVASLIEKEAAYTGEIRNISSVIYNRLTNPNNYPNLEIDATLVYALGGKTKLTDEDLAMDHPYNTYKQKGLPPGAIANPGEYSMLAALDPTDTKYYFYALDTTQDIRQHKFFETFQAHKDFINSLGG
ncbi:MAG: endolytic transglycosylase MltG [Oscillospiraceae bacterium]|nr:endolytic transglycosylase MltG [Oscillospiraceae bacterium]